MVVVLMVAFTIIMVIVFTGLLYRFNTRVTETITTGLSSLIKTGVPPRVSIDESLRKIYGQNYLIFYAVMLSLTAVFGYFLTRFILIPTRKTIEAQKRFIGDVAHELRTPLAIVKANTEVLLLEGEKFDADTRKQLESNIEELDRISEIINNLLTFNRLLRPGRIEFVDIDLSVIVDRAVAKLTQTIRSQNIDIVIKKSDFCSIWANAVAMEQVVMNLLKNALTHTPAGGVITITIRPDYKGHIELVVQDTGRGIAKKDLFHIFEPFYRGDPSRGRKQGGSGLGLAIVSELIRLHNGRISIKSTQGKGTIVYVLLPCGNHDPRAYDASPGGFQDEISIDFLRK